MTGAFTYFSHVKMKIRAFIYNSSIKLVLIYIQVVYFLYKIDVKIT